MYPLGMAKDVSVGSPLVNSVNEGAAKVADGSDTDELTVV